MPGRRSGVAAVTRNRGFVLFAVSQAVSLMGDKLNYMAVLALFAWFAAENGADASRSIAAISVIAALPAILFAPVTGVVVDRVDRRRLMLACDISRAVLVGAIPLVALAAGGLIPVFAVAFLVFFGGMIFNSARMAVIPQLVGERAPGPGRPAEDDSARPDGDRPRPEPVPASRLLAANSFLSLTGRAATLIGMVVGGLAVDWSGWLRLGIRPAWTAGFYLDSLSYLVSIAGIIVVYRRLAGFRPSARKSVERESLAGMITRRAGQAWSDIAESWRFISRTPPVLFVYGAVLALVTVNTAFLILYVPIIQGAVGTTALDLGTRGVGFAAAIGSLGLLLASVGYGLVGHRFRRETIIVFGLLTLGVIAAALPFVRSFGQLAPLAFFGGLALTPTTIAMDTILHEKVPAGARGRVFSNREWVMQLAFAGNAIIIGQLTRLFSNRRILLGIGLLVLALAVCGIFVAGLVRRWKPPEE